MAAGFIGSGGFAPRTFDKFRSSNSEAAFNLVSMVLILGYKEFRRDHDPSVFKALGAEIE